MAASYRTRVGRALIVLLALGLSGAAGAAPARAADDEDLFAAAPLSDETGAVGGIVTFGRLPRGGNRMGLGIVGLDPLTEYTVTVAQGGCAGPAILTAPRLLSDELGSIGVSVDYAASITLPDAYVSLRRAADPAGHRLACAPVQTLESGDAPGMPRAGAPRPDPFAWAGVAVLLATLGARLRVARRGV
jgi:hypothetical protein